MPQLVAPRTGEAPVPRRPPEQLAVEYTTIGRTLFNWLKRNWRWLKWPVALAVLALLYWQNRDQFTNLAERRIEWSDLFTGLVLCAGSIILTFLRWYLLVVALDFPFTVRDALRLAFIGYLFNYVGPGGAGGDLVKAVMIAREQKSRRFVAAATVVIDRVLGVLSLFIVAAMATSISTEYVSTPAFRPYLIGSWVGAIAGLLGLAIIMHPVVPRSRWLNRLVHLPLVGKPIGDLIAALLLYQSRRNVLVAGVLIGVVGHFGMLSSFYFAGRALSPADAIPSYWAHLQFIPAAELFGVLIPLPGGLGALEGAIAYFYTMGGALEANGILTAITYRVITIIIAAAGAGYYLTSRQEIDEALHEAEQLPQSSDGSATSSGNA
jgi:uncharacterized protein (TIRG00374 family)